MNKKETKDYNSLDEFTMEIYEDRILLGHPNCQYKNELTSKFSAFHYVKMITQENTELKEEIERLKHQPKK